jgi:nicotinamidase-related amidase
MGQAKGDGTMTRTSLILVDIQNDYFPGGLWPVEGMEAAAANAATLLARARRDGIPVVHIRHEALSAEAPFFRPGSEGARIDDRVAPLPDETVILKHRPNSFHRTDLDAHLRGAGITRLIVAGAMSQMCIDATTRAAVDLGYEVIVAEDASAARALSLGDLAVPAASVHAAFMAALSGTYATVTQTQSLLSGAARGSA